MFLLIFRRLLPPLYFKMFSEWRTFEFTEYTIRGFYLSRDEINASDRHRKSALDIRSHRAFHALKCRPAEAASQRQFFLYSLIFESPTFRKYYSKTSLIAYLTFSENTLIAYEIHPPTSFPPKIIRFKGYEQIYLFHNEVSTVTKFWFLFVQQCWLLQQTSACEIEFELTL